MVTVADFQVSKSTLNTKEAFIVTVVLLDDNNAKKYRHKYRYRYASVAGDSEAAAKEYPFQYPLDYIE